MNEKKFTRGPWYITEGDEWTHDIHTNKEGEGKWTVASCNGLREEVVANKQLVRTAPDLFDALEPFANFACEDWETHGCHNCIAKRAIKKALGG